MSTMAARAPLCECFARDGLQHEPAFVPTATKRALVERFAALGFPRVEATSYSNPKVVPQFADASELLKSLKRRSRRLLQGDLRQRESGRARARRPRRRLRRERDQPAGLGHRVAHAEEPEPHARRAVAEHRRDGATPRTAASAWSARCRSRSAARSRARSIPASVIADVERFARAGRGARGAGRHHRHGHARVREGMFRESRKA